MEEAVVLFVVFHGMMAAMVAAMVVSVYSVSIMCQYVSKMLKRCDDEELTNEYPT